MARYKIANEILNQVALEVGLLPLNNPVDSNDEVYVQLLGLLNSAGQELVELNTWQMVTKPFEIVVGEEDDGVYALPDDFNYMIDQTGWDRNNATPLGGPLSAQDWTYIEGRDLVSQTIYVSFRQWEGKLYLFPQPPAPGTRLTFEYASRDWVQNASNPEVTGDSVTTGSDIVLLHPLMVAKFLKMKFLQAKGFDSSAAALEFDTVFQSQIGKDKGAPILNAAGNGRSINYLNAYCNVGDTGFGRA